MRVVFDSVTPVLKGLQRDMHVSTKSSVLIRSMAAAGKLLVTSRTMFGAAVSGAPFVPYSTRPYYASVEHRTPGVPQPSGGRTKHKVTGRELKSHVYDGGYGEYKAALGLGSKPNLLLTGVMLASIVISVDSPAHAMLFFPPEAEKRAISHHYGLGKPPRREFFDLTGYERTHLVSEAVRRHTIVLRRYAALRP